MILHLDTNCLVELATRNTPYAKQVLVWLEDGNHITASSIAWSEFCNGPLKPEEYENTLTMLEKIIVPFNRNMAEAASRLFNLCGRRRGSHSDCMIAACAIISQAPLSTMNIKDFERFVPYGLQLHSF